MTAPDALLLRVAAVWPLPGLGLLVLPAVPAPALAAYALHAALATEAVLPDGSRYAATATVEEVTHAEFPGPMRGLLLDGTVGPELPVGTEIRLVEAGPDPYAGLH